MTSPSDNIMGCQYSPPVQQLDFMPTSAAAYGHPNLESYTGHMGDREVIRMPHHPLPNGSDNGSVTEDGAVDAKNPMNKYLKNEKLVLFPIAGKVVNVIRGFFANITKQNEEEEANELTKGQKIGRTIVAILKAAPVALLMPLAVIGDIFASVIAIPSHLIKKSRSFETLAVQQARLHAQLEQAQDMRIPHPNKLVQAKTLANKLTSLEDKMAKRFKDAQKKLASDLVNGKEEVTLEHGRNLRIAAFDAISEAHNPGKTLKANVQGCVKRANEAYSRIIADNFDNNAIVTSAAHLQQAQLEAENEKRIAELEKQLAGINKEMQKEMKKAGQGSKTPTPVEAATTTQTQNLIARTYMQKEANIRAQLNRLKGADATLSNLD